LFHNGHGLLARADTPVALVSLRAAMTASPGRVALMCKIITLATLDAFALAFVSAPVTFDPASSSTAVAKMVCNAAR
jgi:uncharacterized membrane protein